MAVPRAVARDLRRTAAAISKIGDEAVARAAETAVSEGAAVGGRFGRRTLTVVVRDVSNSGGVASATVAGRTAGAWSIKSYGRRGGYTVRPVGRRRRRALDLRGAGTDRTAYARTSPGRTAGDDRWRRWIADPLADTFSDVVDELVADAVEG